MNWWEDDFEKDDKYCLFKERYKNNKYLGRWKVMCADDLAKIKKDMASRGYSLISDSRPHYDKIGGYWLDDDGQKFIVDLNGSKDIKREFMENIKKMKGKM